MRARGFAERLGQHALDLLLERLRPMIVEEVERQVERRIGSASAAQRVANDLEGLRAEVERDFP